MMGLQELGSGAAAVPQHFAPMPACVVVPPRSPPG